MSDCSSNYSVCSGISDCRMLAAKRTLEKFKAKVIEGHSVRGVPKVSGRLERAKNAVVRQEPPEEKRARINDFRWGALVKGPVREK